MMIAAAPMTVTRSFFDVLGEREEDQAIARADDRVAARDRDLLAVHHRADDGGRGRRTRLTGRKQQNRHAASNTRFHDLAGFGCKFQRRYDKAIGIGNEGTRTPFFF